MRMCSMLLHCTCHRHRPTSSHPHDVCLRMCSMLLHCTRHRHRPTSSQPQDVCWRMQLVRFRLSCGMFIRE
jgi:hypothetical protein